ncbi:hypothetical protein V1264_024944 [Littorina saxatilis]|uniref:Sulfatase N-terminal domain-containing protein n=1 Tax=Littorina saxatilis TaxID=31220 RepID=A0AAN9ALQ4_9CAEN
MAEVCRVRSSGTMIVLTLVVAVLSVAGCNGAKQPHIVFIVADDLGWNDVGWHNPAMITPTLNRMASEGVILNSSYVQYLCSPSRTSFMTGYFPYRTGLQHEVIAAGQPRYLPAHFTTLPEMLGKQGYRTHIVGKWHLGMCNWKYTPTERGFESFFGYYSGMEFYYNHTRLDGYDFRANKSVALDPTRTYADYLFVDHALDIIEKHNPEEPLFLYLPFHLVHVPHEVPARFENMYSSIQDDYRRIYCGMVSMLDEAVKNVTDALEKAGLTDNMFLIFTTDNGGPTFNGANNLPLRGAKATYWEGGTRGAGFVHSKNLLQKTGYTNNGMMHAADWFPTLLHLAGSKPDSDIDGVNQWDMLSTGVDSPRTTFVYNIDNITRAAAIRHGDYKLMVGSPGGWNGWYPLPKLHAQLKEQLAHDAEDVDQQWKPQLYNIKEDPEERHDLSSQMPEMMKFLQGELEKYRQKEVPPQNAPYDPAGDPTHFGGVWTPGWC